MDWQAYLEQIRPQVIVSCWSTPAIPPSSWMSAGGSVRYVCHLSGSVRHVISRPFIEQGGLVTNWGDLVCRQVAEHALLLALGCLRNITNWREYIIEKAPQKFNPALTLETLTLFEKRVGIHGFGRIARSLVELLRPFNTKNTAYSKGVSAEFMTQFGVRQADSLEELFRESDIVFECEALTPDSYLSIGESLLRLLPEEAVFVNVGRGLVVDEGALHACAKAGRIRLAMDVAQEEPMTPKSAIFELEDALFSPHIGGPTMDCYHRCGQLALRNLQCYFADEPLTALVTAEEFDRST